MRRDITARFWAKVRKGDVCWTWQGAKHAKGYGQFWHDRKIVRAHRFAYELLVGPIPDGLQLDHLCRNPVCVNPDHLEPVTRRENLRRGIVNKRHCHKGHLYTPENTYVYPSGARACKTCRAEQYRVRHGLDYRKAQEFAVKIGVAVTNDVARDL